MIAPVAAVKVPPIELDVGVRFNPVAAFVGGVQDEQLLVGDEVFLGLGAPTVKSPALSSLSWQPLFFLIAAVVALNVPVGPAASKQLVPVP